jgi:hypothetical protein
MGNTKECKGEDLRKLNQLFFVSLIGANFQLKSIIREFLADNKLNKHSNSFFYYEYFLHQPFNYKINTLKDFKSFWYFAPFLTRLSDKSNLAYDCDNLKRVPADRKRLISNLFVANLNKSLWMDKVLDYLVKKNKQNNKSKKLLENIKINYKGSTLELKSYNKDIDNKQSYYFLVPNYTIKYARDKYVDEKILSESKDENKPLNKRISSISRVIEDTYRLGYLHSYDDTTSLPSLLIPLSTESNFYGELIISFPNLSNGTNNLKIEKLLHSLVDRLQTFLVNYYIPAIIIAHEHFLEKKIKDNGKKFTLVQCFKYGNRIEIIKSIKYDLPWRYRVLKNGKVANNNAELFEKNLYSYWKGMKSVQRSNKSGKNYNWKDRLVFSKYLIAAPCMIDLLKEIMLASYNFKICKKAGSPLPSALIVGKAGSGKDTIPELIRAFSSNENGFNNAEIKIINMAALKPDFAVGAFLSGLKLNNQTMIMEGILTKIAKASYKNPMILVLDELNSMHIDVQGVLLRFLENSEVIPLGEIKSSLKKVRCLVIGIMNEDPEEISREEGMKFIESSKYLGTFVKDILYEHFIHLRRLRPDIKYRLMRGGYFKLKNLEYRQYDIPILLYIYLNIELENIPFLKDKNLLFGMDLVDELLSVNYSWPGNVRQIQAIAKRMIDIILENKELLDDKIYIFAEDLKRAIYLINQKIEYST